MTHDDRQMRIEQPTGQQARDRLLDAMPLTARRLHLAGVSTAVLEGGDGPPLVLLHGAGEFAAVWIQVIPDLVRCSELGNRRTYHGRRCAGPRR